MIEQRLWEVKGPQDFQTFVNMKMLTTGGHDKWGRPTMIVKASNFLPGEVTPEEVIKAGMYIVSAIAVAMPAHID